LLRKGCFGEYRQSGEYNGKHRSLRQEGTKLLAHPARFSETFINNGALPRLAASRRCAMNLRFHVNGKTQSKTIFDDSIGMLNAM